MSTIEAILLATIAIFAILLYRRQWGWKGGYRLPPGPKALPIVGNLLDLPPKGMPEFLHWLKHKDTYGPISSIKLMGVTLVFFHDKEDANTVLGKKAQKTSGRPFMNFAALCGFDKFMGSQQYAENFRKRRAMLHQEMGTRGSSARFQPIQEKESLRFVLRTFHDPNNIIENLKVLAAATMLQGTYGYAIEMNGNDPLVDLIERLVKNFSLATVPLSWPVDAFPAVKVLPDWFPGMSYRKTAQEWKAINEAVVEIPYSFVKRQMAHIAYQPSFVAGLLEKRNEGAGEDVDIGLNYEDDVRWAASSLYAGGSDTTVAIVSSVVLALLMYPEVQQKAQEEIDDVVGTERLPSYEDREKLVYIDSIVKEAWRWNPVAPLGLPHLAEEDIVHGEYVIPKGSYLIPSVWWFLHDPKDYSDPDDFKPERYLPPLNELDPAQFAFGYGRRICPGRLFADSSVYITVVQLLASFRFCKDKDAHGNEIPVKLQPIAGILNHPSPFKFKIEPRSPHYVDLLNRIEGEQEREISDASLLDFSIL